MGAIHVNLGGSTSPFPGWTLKTGSKTVAEVNSNPNIIPIAVDVYFSQGAGTPFQKVKYGDTTLMAVRMYESGGNCLVHMGSNAMNLIKKQITLENISSSSVIWWLEKN